MAVYDPIEVIKENLARKKDLAKAYYDMAKTNYEKGYEKGRLDLLESLLELLDDLED